MTTSPQSVTSQSVTGHSARSSSRTVAGVVLRWVPFMLTLFGTGVSTYLTYEHFTGSTTLACSDTGMVDCLKVTTSSYAMLFGLVPVAVAGLVFFVAGLILNLPTWNRVWTVRLGRVVWALGGVATVFYLVWAELYRLDAICLWCTSIHVVSVILGVWSMFSLGNKPTNTSQPA